MTSRDRLDRIREEFRAVERRLARFFEKLNTELAVELIGPADGGMAQEGARQALRLRLHFVEEELRKSLMGQYLKYLTYEDGEGDL